jgi:hypothetical protein
MGGNKTILSVAKHASPQQKAIYYGVTQSEVSIFASPLTSDKYVK